MKFPNLPRKGKSIEDDVKDIVNYLRSSRVVNVVGGRLMRSPNGTTIEIVPGKSKETGSPTIGTCFFGEIIDIPGTSPVEKGIRGGIIHCGDQNWAFDPQALNLAVAGVWLVSIAVTCEVNRDDDNEILMPGVLTGTRPTGDWTKTAWTVGTDYPENTAPVVSTGEGTVILPIGKLTIADGIATLEPAGCGNFTVTHCAGTLGYTRG